MYFFLTVQLGMSLRFTFHRQGRPCELEPNATFDKFSLSLSFVSNYSHYLSSNQCRTGRCDLSTRSLGSPLVSGGLSHYKICVCEQLSVPVWV